LTPHQILKKYWGYDDFRPLQLDIVQSALAGHDTLALLPTGGGKSVCFQVPALCMDGICVVISPLIALMKDQVKNLQKIGVNAQAIYSGLKYKDIDRILDNCVHGNVKFLYLSPERLQSEIVLERLKKMNVCLLAIDEAHCISQWGYDFRPSYLEIATIRPLLPKTPIIALTATATAPVVKDIQEKLVFGSTAQVFQKSFSRSNLAYVVLYEENKKAKLLEILTKIKGSGVVYVMNRRLTKEIAYYLNQNKISADYYHAGRPNAEREQIQEDWINDKIRIMVATNAFGMGIDKPDVRVVVHLTLPDNLEAYFQEAGRGGRDGNKAFATLLYNQTDKIKLEQQYEQAFPPIPLIKRVYQALGSYYQLAVGGGQWQTFDFDLVTFCKTYNFKPIETLNALKILTQEAYIDLSDNVFIPSTLQILLKKENLYDYLLKSPKMEKLIKVILRSFQGAFNHPVNIRESQLAKFLHIRREKLVELLTKLHQDGIIAYKGQTDSPQLTFLLERLPSESVVINQERYRFLQKRHLFRMNKAVYYAETMQCRSQLLLDYFDEKGADKCGQCDVCLGRHEKYVKHQEYYSIKQKVEYLLKKNPLDLRSLVDEFEAVQKEKVLQTIEHLLDNQILMRDKSLLLRWMG
jgi:ATP-dependent DNA helicase RecQ